MWMEECGFKGQNGPRGAVGDPRQAGGRGSEMSLYRIASERAEARFVEADNFGEALAVFAAWWRARWDPDETIIDDVGLQSVDRLTVHPVIRASDLKIR